MIEMWYGEMKPMNALVDWKKLCTSEKFVAMVQDKLDPEGKIDNMGPNHPRALNHYKRHFSIDNPAIGMTWGMLQALYVYCKEGSEAAAEKFPDWYGGESAPTEKSLKSEKMQQLKGAKVSIGPATKKITVPAELQRLASEAGAEDPDAFLYEVMQNSVPEQWGEHHTGTMTKIINAIAEGRLELGNTGLLQTMWEVGNEQLAES
jgi:hypothetical protein